MSIPVAELGWRRFQFFDKSDVVDPKDPSKSFSVFKDFTIRCWKSAIYQPIVFLGEQKGAIFKLTSTLEMDFWKAYGRELVDISIADTGHRCFIATMGCEDAGQPSVLKIWDLNQWDKQTPFCRISTKVTQNKKAATNTALSVAISNNLDFIAIGFADSSILFSAGEIVTEKSLKWKSLKDGSSSMPDGCLLGIAVTKTADKKTGVFNVCENGISFYILDGTQILKKMTHDNIGTQQNCWYFNYLTNQLVISHQEMVYFYDANSDAGFESAKCHALGKGMDKIQLLCISSYVGVITKQETKLKSRKFMNVLSLYDVDCRYIACTIPSGDAQLFTMGREIFAIQPDGSLWKITEKTTSVKLEIVLQKHLYDVAISIAKRDNSNELASIYGKYADYLYNKGDFQNAIQQYIETIGVLQASFVIRRFLDGTRASQLAMYLEALHARNINSSENIMLLLGAYLKMGNMEKVENFVLNSSKYGNFYVEDAIKLLRASGNYKWASYMATEYEKVLLIFAILVEDLCDFDEAARRLTHVDSKHIFDVLDAYGLTLLEHKENEVMVTVERAVASENVNIEVLIKLLNGHPEYLKRLYERANKQVKENLQMRNAVLEHILERMNATERKDLNFQTRIFDLVAEDNYDVALRLGQLHSYSPLVIHVLRQQEKNDELLRYVLRDGDITDIIQACGQDTIKNMWIELVTFLSKKQNMPEIYVTELLKKIIATNHVHPLIVTKILSKNAQLPVTCVKPYLEQWFAEEGAILKSGIKTIADNVSKLNSLESEIQIYDEDVQLFRAHTCVVCGHELETPSVHFMCKDSCHSHCYESYSDQQEGCPKCTDIDLMVSSREYTPINSKEIVTEIAKSGNALSVIADLVSKGMFDDEVSESEDKPKSTNPFNDIKNSTNPFDND